jgi:gluconolactonase
MKRLRLLALVALAGLPLLAARAEDKKEDKSFLPKKKVLGTIERRDPAFDKLIGKGAKLEVLAEGFTWVEGPVWDKKGGYLLFSDIPTNSVYKWQKGKGIQLYLRPSGYTGKRTDLAEPGSNGLLLDAKGRLILMQHGDRCVARLNDDHKTFTKLATEYKGTRLNSPNDGAFKSNGDLYFTDPPYGLMIKGKGATVFPGQELDFCGVYRLSKGKLTLLTKEMTKPNGIAFSPDEKTLYVANSDPKKAIWMAFPVNEDGKLGKGRVFFDAGKWVGKRPGLPDGMKVDADGNVFATGPGGVLVFAPDGKHLGTIATGVPTANCAWGDDGTVLYVAADKALCRIRTMTKGKGF